MIGQKIFTVLTEFKFEVGAAVAGATVLESHLGRLSNLADQATNSVSMLGSGLLATAGLNFTGFGAGILSIFSAAVMSSEKFRDSQLSLINLMSANRDKLTGPIDTFADKAAVASTIIKNVAKQAREFALPEQELLDMTKLLAAQLVPKGLAGDNFGMAIDLGRNLLKSAPNLGIDPAETQGQLLRIIEGSASMGDTLFRRLVAETDAFSKFKTSGSKGFNAIDPAKRLQILSEGLNQFAKDTDVLSERVNSLTGQLAVFKDNLTGAFGILRPMGDTIKTVLIGILKAVNNVLENEGKRIVGVINAILKDATENPQALLTTLLQFKRLRDDLGKTQNILQTAGIFSTIGAAIAIITKKGLAFVPVIGWIVAGFQVLGDAAQRANNPIIAIVSSITKWALILGTVVLLFAKLGWLMPAMAFALNALILPFTVIFGLMQVLSRAMAIANINDAKAAPGLIAKGAEALLRLKDATMSILDPFIYLGDQLAHLIAPIFQISTYGDKAIGVLDIITRFLQGIGQMAGIFVTTLDTIATGIADFISRLANLTAGDFANLAYNPGQFFNDLFKGMGTNMMTTMREGLLNIGNPRRPGEEGANGVVSNITQIGKVEVRQDFKEQQEPDRIANSLVKTLTAIGKNPTQAAGGSLQGAILR